MKLILDENVPEVADSFRRLGHEVVVVRGSTLAHVPDKQVFARVRKERALFVTHDRDFVNTRRFPPKQTGGVIVLRTGRLKQAEQAALLVEFLSRHPESALRGVTVLLHPGRPVFKR